MDHDHPRWEEFQERLQGPEGCDFKADQNGETTWRCGGRRDQTLATAILRDMRLTPQAIVATLAYFDANGGQCDCEVLFNVAGKSRAEAMDRMARSDRHGGDVKAMHAEIRAEAAAEAEAEQRRRDAAAEPGTVL
jgi:hypothetical protein